MIAGTVWNKLKTTLEGSPILNGYIKVVFEGRRFDIEPNSLPCIMLEPTFNHEVIREVNNVAEIEMGVDVYAFSSANHHEFNKTIVGDYNYKGILDIENDIRQVLSSSYNLGGNVIDTRPETSEFDQIDFDKYPVRGVRIPLRIKFKQISGV